MSCVVNMCVHPSSCDWYVSSARHPLKPVRAFQTLAQMGRAVGLKNPSVAKDGSVVKKTWVLKRAVNVLASELVDVLE